MVMLKLLFVFLCYPVMEAYANTTIDETVQSRMLIRGKVIDISGNSLPGANVTVEGTTRGVVTDTEGYYVIEAEKGEVLIFSFIGFHEQKVTIGNRLAIDVTLTEETTLLDEAVVVGMGKQRKVSVIGSISSVSTQDLMIPQRSLVSSLSGRIAGATIVQRSGEPGYDNASFWVRGLSSFTSSAPLILVDGVERDMNNVSIEEVESISILKDASATAVYGVRAANGVVVITTKRGIAQKPVIDVKMETGISDLPNLPKFLDGANYAMLYNEALGHENYSKDYIENLRDNSNRFIYPNVNWFDEIFKKWSTNSNATININGGAERARYFVSAGFFQEKGNLRNYPLNNYDSNITVKRYNFRSNIDMNLTKSTIVNLELGANLMDQHEPGVGNRTLYSTWFNSPVEELYYWAYLSNPLAAPVRLPIGKNVDGNTLWGWGAPSQIGELNPAERLLGSGYHTRYTFQIMSQLILNQDLSFLLKGLNLKGFFSYDGYNNSSQARLKQMSTYAVDKIDDDTGEFTVKEITKGSDVMGYSFNSGSSRAIEAKAQLNYEQIFMNSHRVGGMLMYYQRDFNNNTASTSITSFPYRKQGIAFRSTYSFRDTYFTEFNIGYNGSENFPKQDRFGIFPAIALGYVISNETFWKFKPVNFLKLRGSYGLVGSEALPNNLRYAYLSTWGSGLGGYAWGYNPTAVGGLGEQQVGLTTLTWEKGLKKNLGIEFKLFNDLFSFDFDLFHEKRYDILITRSSIPAISGFNQSPFANMGKMVNRGFETTIEVNEHIDKLNYRIYGNFAFNRNKILFNDEPQGVSPQRMLTGRRYGQQFGLTAIGLFKDQEEIDNSPEQTFGAVRPGDVKYADLNGDEVIDIDDISPIGYSSIPEINYGFGAQFLWKGFDLGIFFRGQANVTYSLGGSTFIPFSEGVGKGNVFAKALDRWTPENPNPNAFYPRMSNGRSTNNWQISTRTIYSGDFLRLGDLEFGYNINKKYISTYGMQGLRLYLLATNVALWSKWDMWDPETGTQNGNRYPLPRKLNFGLRATF